MDAFGKDLRNGIYTPSHVKKERKESHTITFDIDNTYAYQGETTGGTLPLFNKPCTTKFHRLPQKSDGDEELNKGLFIIDTVLQPEMKLVTKPTEEDEFTKLLNNTSLFFTIDTELKKWT